MEGMWGARREGLSSLKCGSVGCIRRVLLASAGALLVASSTAAAAAPTHAVTIGANLRTAPNVTFDCSVIPFEFSPFGTGGPSCAWGTPLVPGTSRGGLDVPGTGNIFRVKLRVGPKTGRMQLVILRTLFDPNDLANNECCVITARSSVFTPVHNGITTLNVKLPVKLGALGSVDVLDQVGLQILEDNVPIPVISEINRPIGNQLGDQPTDNMNAPAFTKLGTFALAADPAGYLLDMQAEWFPPGQHP